MITRKQAIEIVKKQNANRLERLAKFYNWVEQRQYGTHESGMPMIKFLRENWLVTQYHATAFYLVMTPFKVSGKTKGASKTIKF